MITPNSTLLFWQDLCHVAPTVISKQEANIIESFKRSRPILHVRWLRKFVGQESSKDQATIIQILEHRRHKNMDSFLTEYQDGSKQLLTQEQIILAKGVSWFNAQMDRLSAVKLETLLQLKRQISQSTKIHASKTQQQAKRMKQQMNNGKQLSEKKDTTTIKSGQKSKTLNPRVHKRKISSSEARWQKQNNMIPSPRQLTSGRISRPKKQFDL